MLSEVKGSGLLIEVEYTRTASQYGSGYVYMHLVLTNTKGHTLCNIAMEPPAKMAKGMDVKPFADILNLHSGNSVNANLHINFGGKAQVAKFKITFDDGECVSVPLKPLLGEVLVPNPIDGTSFESTQKSLSGLQEASCTVDLAAGTDGAALIAGAINAAAVEGGTSWRFSLYFPFYIEVPSFPNIVTRSHASFSTSPSLFRWQAAALVRLCADRCQRSSARLSRRQTAPARSCVSTVTTRCWRPVSQAY